MLGPYACCLPINKHPEKTKHATTQTTASSHFHPRTPFLPFPNIPPHQRIEIHGWEYVFRYWAWGCEAAVPLT